MFNRKIKAILFIFIVLFCISAVNAVSIDNVTDDQTVNIINEDSETNVKIIEEAADNIGSFSDLNKTINNNTNGNITLNKDYIYNATTDKKLNVGITISRDLTIDGQGHTIDGNHTVRIFMISSSITFTLKNINLINGKYVTHAYGGAIYSSGNSVINVINSNFTNNTGLSGGGAIYNAGIVNVINSTFNNNTLTSTVTAAGGGAIYCRGNFTIINSTFSNNIGKGSSCSGGAIYNTNGGNITIINSNFINNSAKTNGGAICTATSYNYYFSITNSNFINNTANATGSYNGGGAIYISGNAEIVNSTFHNNKAYNGGAIYNYKDNITLINSTFTNNTAKYNAGAVYGRNSLNIVNSTFANNSAKYTGGVIYLYSTNYDTLNIVKSTFINNIATSHGGVIYTTINNGNVSINNSYFNNNTGTIGGAIYISVKNFNVVNSTFTNNTGRSHGGAIYCSAKNTIVNSTFNNNNAPDGGSIYAQGSLKVINSDFNNNSAKSYGGAIYNTGSTINVTNSRFNNNTGGSYGGVIAGTNLIISNSTFNNNSARSYGGVLYGTTSGDIIVVNSKFNNNSAAYGGVIYNNKGNIIVTNSNFNNNKATNGGVIYNTNGINITNSTFKNNNATNGGAIYSNGGNMTITKSEFTDNNATNGGAIYYINTKNVANVSFVVVNSNFSNNSGKLGDDIYTGHDTTVLNNNYTKNSYANIYANNTIVNCSVVSVLGNISDRTYYVTDPEGKYRLHATVFADGASINGYNLTITDGGTNKYNANYTGYGMYEIEKDLFADFLIKEFTAIINDDTTTKYVVENGTVVNTKLVLNVTVAADDIVYGEDVEINITLTNEDGSIATINDQITVEINGMNYTVNLTDGKGKLTVSGLNAGKYNVTAIFNGNSLYDPANGTGNFTVYKIDPNLELNVTDIVFGENETMSIIMNPDINGNVTVYIDSKNITVEIRDGKGELIVEGLKPGNYSVFVDFDGNNNYHPKNTTGNFTVTNNNVIVSDDFVKYYRNGTQFYATFYDIDGNPLSNTNVTFTIHGVTYTRTTDKNGVAMLNINLYPGKYTITSTNPVNNETRTNKVTVLTTISADDVVKFFRNGTQYYVKCLDQDGSPLVNTNVSIYVHGVYYNRTTDENGIAELNITLNPGEYDIISVNPWNNETCCNKITVYTVVLSEDLEMTTSDRKPFKVTILDGKGKPLANAKVSFNIHGIFYHKTTDANGVISLNLNLIAGKYIITTMYDYYNVSSIITVL